MPLNLNGHSTNFQTDSAYKLRNDIVAKAGDMIFFGTGYPIDTINSFDYHFQYPLTYTIKQKEKYSFLYLRTIKDTFNITTLDSNRKGFGIALNPFMLYEQTVLQKIANAINNNVSKKKRVTITLQSGLLPLSEEGQSILHRALDKVIEQIQLANTNIEIDHSVDWENSVQMIINGKELPIFIIVTE